ncbi:MAG: phospho-N-acetylmuramoyl-pentapeptide-transferase [Planctomycetaceae bacterium]|nr:phospho-N-acetylmuramoyl-pentapeptide-transferase [Planctomycetaceae bacterium]
MIYWLFLSPKNEALLLRLAGAGVLSFLLVVLLAPRVIRLLVRYKVGDRPEFDHANLNELTRHKSNTPTMGGALIVASMLVSILIFANVFGNMFVRMGLLVLIWLGVLGGIDDWLKLRHAPGTPTRDGLRSWEKLVFQIGLALLVSIFMRHYYRAVEPAQFFYFPFLADPIAIGLTAHIIITTLTMVGTSNAVNLTDGMDGLAAGCLGIVAVVFLLISFLVSSVRFTELFRLPLIDRSVVEMAILCASMLGACLGFLWWNSPPAHVFMGDTGSLPLGGMLGYIAVVTRQELLLFIAGGVFVTEALSVMIQISVFKMTKGPGGREGRRVFRCAPLHHHFHLGGWAESKVVVRFWMLGVIFAALALATLKLKIE